MKELEFLSRSLIAHRGYYNNKKGIPENSVLAFKKAIDNNYLIELDVRLTKDQKLVVFHDDNLKRVCGVNKRVKDLTYKELLKYNLFDTTLKVPLFSDVIKLVNGRVPILIETKYHNRYGVLEKILINELEAFMPFKVFILCLFYGLKEILKIFQLGYYPVILKMIQID